MFDDGCPYLSRPDREFLITRWSEPHRRYHDVQHLRQVLASLRVLQSAGTDFDDEAVTLAAWFHDAVYAIGSSDNEEDSALLAESMLKGRACATEVARLVRVTSSHATERRDLNGAALCDADLSVLASSPADYAVYCSRVRDEYSSVTDDAYRTGRANILNGLLQMDWLYKTDFGRVHWERPARENLQVELSRLRR